MGRRSLSVLGLGIGTRVRLCAGVGRIRVASANMIISVSAVNHVSGRRLNMFKVNCRWRLFDGIFPIALRNASMWGGRGWSGRM